MALIRNCPSCGKQVQVPDQLLGQEVQCSLCLAQFLAAADAGVETVPTAELAALHAQEEAPVSAVPERSSPPHPADATVAVAKPAKVQAIGIMTLVGGILALMVGLGLTAGSAGFCCAWPGTYYTFLVGVLGIVKGAQLVGETAYLQPVPRSIAILQIINIVNGDIPNCVMGIVSLVFQNEPEVRRYFHG